MAKKRGVPKNIESPDKMEQLFEEYKKATKDNPFIIEDWVGGLGKSVDRKKERPLTMAGFSVYLSKAGIIERVKDYMSNKDDRYADFAPICSRIREEIRQDQIEGGMSGMYNPSITQRLNGLTDKVETTNVEQPLFGPDEEGDDD
jgi:hypothetical protein